MSENKNGPISSSWLLPLWELAWCMGHSAGHHLEDRQRVTEQGLETGSSPCLLPSPTELRLWHQEQEGQKCQGTRHFHASFNPMTCFDINRSLSPPGKEAIRPWEGEQMLAELTQEKMLPDSKCYCPVPSRKAENQARVRMTALWARRVTGAQVSLVSRS